ncbi:MAG: zinc-ribbon domain-containing protein [Roseobacter sp.]
MRLICPNCDAEYEVPSEVMPTEGRDVQCSNCGQTWFQNHPDTPAEEQAGEGADGAPVEHGEPSRTQDEDDTQSIEPTDTSLTTPNQPEESRAPEPAAQRRALDQSVADVLRAEAEMEARARRKEAISVESQPDPGLEESIRSADRPSGKSLRYPIPTLHEDNEYEAEPPEFLAESSSATGAPKDLFPDIEEINSTLRSNNDRSPEEDAGQTAQIEDHEKRNSRFGFSLTVVLAAALAIAYIFAPQVVEAIPQAEAFMSSYVSTVDTWRAWLDGQISTALSWLDTAVGSSTP